MEMHLIEMTIAKQVLLFPGLLLKVTAKHLHRFLKMERQPSSGSLLLLSLLISFSGFSVSSRFDPFP